MKNIFKRLFLISLCSLFIALPCFAYASEVNLENVSNQHLSNFSYNKLSEEDVRKILYKEGTEKEVADNLILKLKRGELWDSFKEEYQFLKPQINTNNFKKTLYPDGSFKIEEIKKLPTNDLQLRRKIISEDRVQVYRNWVVVNVYFEMSFLRNTDSGRALITNQTKPVIDIYDISGQGSVLDLDYGYIKEWRNPTYAWVSFYIVASTLTDQVWLKGFVNGNGYWTESHGI